MPTHFFRCCTLSAKQYFEAFPGGLLSNNVYDALRNPFAVEVFKLFLSEEDDGGGSGVLAFIPTTAHSRKGIHQAIYSQAFIAIVAEDLTISSDIANQKRIASMLAVAKMGLISFSLCPLQFHLFFLRKKEGLQWKRA